MALNCSLLFIEYIGSMDICSEYLLKNGISIVKWKWAKQKPKKNNFLSTQQLFYIHRILSFYFSIIEADFKSISTKFVVFVSTCDITIRKHFTVFQKTTFRINFTNLSCKSNLFILQSKWIDQFMVHHTTEKEANILLISSILIIKWCQSSIEYSTYVRI